MPVKNIVIELDTEYLQEAAKARGITRTSLVRIVMEKVVSEKLVSNLLGDDKIVIPKKPKYRRFPPKG